MSVQIFFLITICVLIGAPCGEANSNNKEMTSLNKNSRRQSNEDEILGRRKSTSTSSISNLVSLNIIYQQGETALLPCDISVPNDTRSIDQLVLIMWYREDVGSPIYSIGMP
ncbi:uncharacterized protein [Lepeophtheirus salmonis]|uniref:uncharacterized protein n=1 Tax=Lepeophtheirus salmonis TaxID=72036 RepID=UPI003AF3FF96